MGKGWHTILDYSTDHVDCLPWERGRCNLRLVLGKGIGMLLDLSEPLGVGGSRQAVLIARQLEGDKVPCLSLIARLVSGPRFVAAQQTPYARVEAPVT